ncbi:carbohydrate ABC transporter permease [Alkaliphilus serpentinus]|uniref:Sugar ABC transporter permease n=1 Tax=Alkaliphilus serpentinus TaxID=1482731 RepID=A0A833HLP0_9FIRM|nr:sugar ABC transporter permease [Alkaliphilus serpentinus]KAB3526225.1 sugar ABC transporter permease [Alkaliphilus serpentinus]
MVGDKKGKKLLVIGAFLLPSLLSMALFNLLPILISAVVSLTDWDMLGKPKFVGLLNYINVFTEEKSYIAIFNIFKFLIGYIPLVLGLGLLFATLLNRNIKGAKVFRGMFFIPVITSWVAVSIIWKWLLNGNTGIINYVLSLVGVQGPVWLSDFFWAMPAIIMASVWKDVGFVTIILLSGLADISNDYYEAAKIDGANTINQFFKITLPLLTPTIYFILVISLINCFQLFDQVMVMTGGGPAGSTSTMVEQIFKNAFKNYRMGFAAAQSWILFSIIFIITLVMNKLQKRWVNYEDK